MLLKGGVILINGDQLDKVIAATAKFSSDVTGTINL
jgi:hypothetical protein